LASTMLRIFALIHFTRTIAGHSATAATPPVPVRKVEALAGGETTQDGLPDQRVVGAEASLVRRRNAHETLEADATVIGPSKIEALVMPDGSANSGFKVHRGGSASTSHDQSETPPEIVVHELLKNTGDNRIVRRVSKAPARAASAEGAAGSRAHAESKDQMQTAVAPSMTAKETDAAELDEDLQGRSGMGKGEHRRLAPHAGGAVNGTAEHLSNKPLNENPVAIGLGVAGLFVLILIMLIVYWQYSFTPEASGRARLQPILNPSTVRGGGDRASSPTRADSPRGRRMDSPRGRRPISPGARR